MYFDEEEDDISDEEISEIVNVIITRRPKQIKVRPDFFNIFDEQDFFARFRMTKMSAFHILQLIRPHIQHRTTWNNALPPEQMLLLTIRGYATGCMLTTVGDIFHVSKSTSSRVVTLVSHHIAMLRDRFIYFPKEPEEITVSKSDFYSMAKFPNVIGALDCTHVKIISPGGEDAELYRNRKGYFSLNLQTVCDAKLKIVDIVARWPGSTHDSMIFKNSRMHARFETGEIYSCLIVADGGYESTNYILTPLSEVRTREENLYNESLIRTRNCVERSYGVWKRRFPILSLGMRMKLTILQSIIVPTAVLHNLCCQNKELILPHLPEDAEN